MIRFLKLFAAMLLSSGLSVVKAQADSSVKTQIIVRLQSQISQHYWSEVKARAMRDSLDRYLKIRRYENTQSMDDFAWAVTQDLRRISSDKHIVVEPYHETLVSAVGPNTSAPKTNKQIIAETKRIRKEFDRVSRETRAEIISSLPDFGSIELLPHGVGYIQVKDFSSASEHNSRAGLQTIKRKLNSLRNCSALIVDLRGNSGGYTKIMARFVSMFVFKDSQYLSTSITFFRNTIEGITTQDTLQKRNYTFGSTGQLAKVERQLYVLIDHATFSAGEDAAYQLKKLIPEALLVGEHTAVSGNASILTFGDFQNYTAQIPNIRMIDEERGGLAVGDIGVSPDVPTNPDSALFIAYKLATGKSLPHASLLAVDSCKVIDVQKFSGVFGPYEFGNENGCVVMTVEGRLKYKLQQITLSDFRGMRQELIHFVFTDGELQEIKMKYSDGYTASFKKARG